MREGLHRALMQQPTPEQWLELADLILAATYASDEADELLARYGRGEVSIDALKDSLRALAVRH
jgi:hypothetical protein